MKLVIMLLMFIFVLFILLFSSQITLAKLLCDAYPVGYALC